MMPTRDPTHSKISTQAEREGLRKKNIPIKWTGKKKKAMVAILTSDKMDFKTRAIKRDPEGNFLIFKGRIN